MSGYSLQEVILVGMIAIVFFAGIPGAMGEIWLANDDRRLVREYEKVKEARLAKAPQVEQAEEQETKTKNTKVKK